MLDFKRVETFADVAANVLRFVVALAAILMCSTTTQMCLVTAGVSAWILFESEVLMAREAWRLWDDKQLKDDIGSDLQHNLPTSLALPTLYEVRRLNQMQGSSASTAMGGGIGYQDNRTQDIVVYVSNGRNTYTRCYKRTYCHYISNVGATPVQTPTQVNAYARAFPTTAGQSKCNFYYEGAYVVPYHNVGVATVPGTVS